MAPVPIADAPHRAVFADFSDFEISLVVIHEGREKTGTDGAHERVVAHVLANLVDHVPGKARVDATRGLACQPLEFLGEPAFVNTQVGKIPVVFRKTGEPGQRGEHRLALFVGQPAAEQQSRRIFVERKVTHLGHEGFEVRRRWIEHTVIASRRRKRRQEHDVRQIHTHACKPDGHFHEG